MAESDCGSSGGWGVEFSTGAIGAKSSAETCGPCFRNRTTAGAFTVRGACGQFSMGTSRPIVYCAPGVMTGPVYDELKSFRDGNGIGTEKPRAAGEGSGDPKWSAERPSVPCIEAV